MITILKQPKDLKDNELSKIFDSVIDHSFDKWVLDDLRIEKNNGYGKNINVTTISCNLTGYYLWINEEYIIKASSSEGFDVPLNMVKLFSCLLEIGAVKLN